MIIRRLRLTWPSEVDPMVVPGQPEESFGMIALSLLLPYLEPYLIRSMNHAKAHVTDPKLQSDIAIFNGQEGQHYQQHRKFNEAVRLGAAEERVRELEAELAEDYRRFSAQRTLRFNLAYAEGFEAFTLAMARFFFATRRFELLEPPRVRELVEWHLVEELEHRTVAFDVYAHVCGSYFYRLFVGLYAHWHLGRFTVRVAMAMKAALAKESIGVWVTFLRMRPLIGLLLRLLLPKVLWTYLPWYSPHRIEMSPELAERANHYERVTFGQ
jgi:predicted metal-dependent hydrolase